MRRSPAGRTHTVNSIWCAIAAVALATAAQTTVNATPADIVIYANDVGSFHGVWSKSTDASAAGSTILTTPDTGFQSLDNPLASPANYFDANFAAPAGVTYRLWLRLRATGNSKWNDSVWLQFSDALDGAGSPIYRLNSTSGLLVNLATDSSASSLNGWGWQNTAYWLTQTTALRFASSGSHTIRIQVREDGVQLDQIVLSPILYLNTSPGALTSDATVVRRVDNTPSPWVTEDIGAVGLQGNAWFSSGTFSLSGAGDISGTGDAFRMVYQPLPGDQQITARVERIGNAHPFAKTGVMIRDGVTAVAAHVTLDVNPTGGIELIQRAASGGVTTTIAGAASRFPVWLRLKRMGNTIVGSTSNDGTTWTVVGAATTSLPPSVNFGMVVTSHDTQMRNTATVDRVTAGSAGLDIVKYAADIMNYNGMWTRTNDVTAAGGVALSTPDSGFASVDVPIAQPAHYFEVSFDAPANISYRLWLRLRATANSKWNDSVWAQFSDALANGSPVFRLGTTSALLVNLATDSSASSLNGWGWQNGAYWLNQPTSFTFATTGTHRLRVQVREDGVQLDQIVLSPNTYVDTSPGLLTGDSTILSNGATNVAPVVALRAPANGASYPDPAAVVVTARASDQDGSVSRVDFFADGNLIGRAVSRPYTITWPVTHPASYSLTAKAFDDQGVSAVSAPITVVITDPPGPDPNPPPPGSDKLMPGQWLGPGQAITSSDGRYELIYQNDGNLVVYAPGPTPIWDTHTAGTTPGGAIMQDDGNFVVYADEGGDWSPLWSSGTYGNPGAYLVMQTDGNLVVYSSSNSPLWASGTASSGSGGGGGGGGGSSSNCVAGISPSSMNFDASGGNGTATVSAPSDCTWSADSQSDWISATGSGTGNGTISVTVDANSSSSSRLGWVAVGNQTLQISEQGQNNTATGCPQPNGNDTVDDTEAIQCLLDQGGTVTLDADVSNGYRIGPHPVTGKGLVLRQSGTVLTSRSAYGYRALLVATPALTEALMQVENEDVTQYTISNIFLWGNRFQRQCINDPDPPNGTGRHRNQNVNLELHGGNFTIDNIESDAAPCGSSVSISSGSRAFEIVNSWIANNGWPQGTTGQGTDPWSDGMTVLACVNGVIHYNHFVDNTDIDLILGGTRHDAAGQADASCSVDHNEVNHYQTYGFGGLMVGWFPNNGVPNVGDGFHGGLTMTNNIVSAQPDELAFGLMVGHHPWESSINLTNVGSVTNNIVSGTVINLAVEADRVGAVQGSVIDNNVSNSRGVRAFYHCSISANYTVYGPHAGQIALQPDWFELQYDDQTCIPR